MSDKNRGWTKGPDSHELYVTAMEDKAASELAAPPCSPNYWRSCAEWPEGLINNISGEGKNVSKDRHDTKEQAEAVCSILHVQGFGGERCHFPVRTWVEPVYSENSD